MRDREQHNSDQPGSEQGSNISSGELIISSEVSFDSPEQFLERLRKALKKDGDFPASARVVNELKQLVSDPKTTSNQIAELILKEPSLGVRVLHLVNSSFYRRAKPIMTVTQAVIQIGMKPLAELCAGLVLLQRFVPVARRGGVFAASLQQIVMTSLLTSSISEACALRDSKNTAIAQASRGSAGESGYLAGSLRELGLLLMAYYFPAAYEAAAKRAESKRMPIAQGIKEVIGLSPYQISIEVLQALELPDLYRHIIIASESSDPSQLGPEILPSQRAELSRIARSLGAASKISASIAHEKNKAALDALLADARKSLGLDGALDLIIGKLPEAFSDQCSSIELPLAGLPEYLRKYGQTEVERPKSGAISVAEDDTFSRFVDEIRASVDAREPTAAVITSVMESLTWGIGFERVVLLLTTTGKRSLVGRMGLGKLDKIDTKAINRPISNSPGSDSPDIVAFLEGRPVFNGTSIIPNGWPIAAVPIGFGARCIGVIYADCLDTPTRDPKSLIKDELSQRQQAAIGVLAELLDRSVKGGN